MTSVSDDPSIAERFGAHYFAPGARAEFEAPARHAYYFKTYVGEHRVEVPFGDCLYSISHDRNQAELHRGPCMVESHHCATLLRGFMPPSATASLHGVPVLPYVNGCATRQVFPPPRPGDPTLQYLSIPPFSAEQAHHIHSTVRVAYVLAGRGRSIVGMPEASTATELVPGMVCVLEPMCPHHFETPFGEYLEVVPLHIFSAVSAERSHPMLNGTVLVE